MSICVRRMCHGFWYLFFKRPAERARRKKGKPFTLTAILLARPPVAPKIKWKTRGRRSRKKSNSASSRCNSRYRFFFNLSFIFPPVFRLSLLRSAIIVSFSTICSSGVPDARVTLRPHDVIPDTVPFCNFSFIFPRYSSSRYFVPQSSFRFPHFVLQMFPSEA